MGEVYLARDTRLDRLVAIKALPAHLAQDPDRLTRFQREAKLLAALNHPNIAGIHGLEEANGHQYLVLEFVEGQTLATLLAKGPLPLHDALTLARQMAEALEAAHEKGIVHRDLKPGNVMVTSEGMAKVLDFGLARGVDGASSTPSLQDLANSPTITTPMGIHSPTIAGVIMGTAGYMSPEQARGKPVDKRSDIFSFGCVVFEMLTGAQPFKGETVADAIGATLHREPDLALLPAGTPRRVRDLLSACLAKDRRNRLHDMGDARIELDRALAAQDEAPAAAAPPRAWWRRTAVLVPTILLVTASPFIVRGLAPHAPGTAGPASVVRTQIAPPSGLSVNELDRGVAVSPDGRHVVLSLVKFQTGEPLPLYLRDLARLDWIALAGTDGGTYPCFSPDGKSIAFFAERKLKRLDMGSGIVRVLCDAPAGRGVSWGSKGTIVFAPGADGGLKAVSDSGGTPREVTEVEESGESHRHPCFLPSGDQVIYLQARGEGEGVYALDLNTMATKQVLPTEAEALYVEPGYLLYALDEHLMAQPFDPQSLSLTGKALPVAANISYEKGRGFINAGASSHGTLVYQLVNPPPQNKLFWMDRKGSHTSIPGEALEVGFGGGALAPDGRKAVMCVEGKRRETFVSLLDLERGTRTRLSDPTVWFTYSAQWTADGQSIIVSEVRDSAQCISRIPVSGGKAERLLSEAGFEYGIGGVTSDGTKLLFSKTPLSTKRSDIWELDLTGAQKPRCVLQSTVSEWDVRPSPNSDMIAFLSTDGNMAGGTLQVAAYPNATSSVQVSLTPANLGYCWTSPTELCWVDMSQHMWATTVTCKDGKVEVGATTPLLDGKPLEPDTLVLCFDPHRDSFLIGVPKEGRAMPQLIYLNDWRAAIAGEQGQADR